MAEVTAQIASGELTLGEITNACDLERNFIENAIPSNLTEVTAGSYPEFLAARRKLIAAGHPLLLHPTLTDLGMPKMRV